MAKMTGFERKQVLIHELQRAKVLHLTEMIQLLQVSESTVRRDFEELIHAGLAIRIYGGISLPGSGKEALTIQPTHISQIDIKEELCRKASRRIEDGMCVFIDGGTTFVNMMRYLSRKKITVVTNNALLLPAYYKSQARLIFLGGQYSDEFYISTGEITSNELLHFKFDLALMGCDALDVEENAAYAIDMNVGSNKQMAMQRAVKSILVADSSKFNNRGVYQFASLADFDCFYTDPSKYIPELNASIETI